MKKYRVTCLNCKDSDVLTIEEHSHTVMFHDKSMLTPFLSVRWRGDEQFGFECKCGNDNRIGVKEADKFKELVHGDPLTVKRIRESMKIPDARQFQMEAA